MAGGSLFREIEKQHLKNGIELSTDIANADFFIVRRAIIKRANKRFALLKSIY
ncbi:MAG: hypothetical protein ACI9DS_002500 [Glaciecola sp.]|jgi:hypothetical protein